MHITVCLARSLTTCVSSHIRTTEFINITEEHKT